MNWRLAALYNGFQDATAYRIEFLFEIVGAAIVPAAIQWVLWYALFKVGHRDLVAGMTYSEMLQYTWISLLFSQVRGGDQDFELSEMIRSGGLSQYLLKPVSAIEFVYVRGVAPKLFIAGFGLTIGWAYCFWSDLSPYRMVGAMFLALLGNIIHYQFGTLLSSTAFYWEESYSILMVKNMIVNLLSGELIPLTLFPASMSWIWKSTPFYLYVFGPVQYATGKWTNQEFAYQLLISGAWMAGFAALIKITWSLGIKKYISLGG